MSALLDTSMLVRYLTADPPHLAAQAAQVIDLERDLLVSDVVLAETAYVLTSVYQVARQTVVDTLVLFLQKENIRPFAYEKDILLQALLLCRPSGRISFADALIWAAARASGTRLVYSLDKRFPDIGIEVRDRPHTG